jgi:hypothetical protein
MSETGPQTTSNDVQGELPLTSSAELIEEESATKLPEDKLCTACMELNLTQAGVVEKFLECPTCNELFCEHAVSKLDPKYCIYCCNDFKVIDVNETIQREHKNDAGQITSVVRHTIRHLTLSGLHWLFYNRAINSLQDVELEHAIEYHRGILNGMLFEREARRTANAHRNKGKVAGNENRSLIESTVANPIIQTGEGAKFVTTSARKTTTRTKSVKNISASGVSASQKQAVALVDALKTLMQAGMSQEQIAALAKK